MAGRGALHGTTEVGAEHAGGPDAIATGPAQPLSWNGKSRKQHYSDLYVVLEKNKTTVSVRGITWFITAILSGRLVLKAR